MRSSSAKNTVRPRQTLVIPNLAESQARDLAMRLSYLQRVRGQKLSSCHDLSLWISRYASLFEIPRSLATFLSAFFSSSLSSRIS